jgi:hypothetical protein
VPPTSPPPAQPPNTDTGPDTLGSPDLGDEVPDTQPQSADDQSSSQDNTAASSGSESEPAPPPDIPATQPTTTQQINAVLRNLATWLGRALALLGVAFELDPEVALVSAAIEAASWLADYQPKIWSYLDAPKTLAELQSAATRSAPPGYEIHHIVEAQKGSSDPRSNALRFPGQIDALENLVRIPYWKHVEISAWYSRANRDYGGLSPREYLRGKSWQEQYDIGINKLRDFGVLR